MARHRVPIEFDSEARLIFQFCVNGVCVITWNRPRLLTVVAVVVATVGLYVSAPFLMLWRLRSAAERNDTGTLEQLLDFPAVRAGLKEQARSALRDQVASAIHSRLVAGWIGGTSSPEVVDRAIDERVTPAAAAQLIRDAKIEHAGFTGLTTFTFEARGINATARFSGFRWRVNSIRLPGQR